MAKNVSITKNYKPAFVAGRRNRLLCLRAELSDFAENILANAGRTPETEGVLDAMAGLIGAIDDVKDGKGAVKSCPSCGRPMFADLRICYSCLDVARVA